LINDCTLVISPEHLDTLVRSGVTSKAELARRLWRECNALMASSFSTIIQNKLIADNKLTSMAPFIGGVAGGFLRLVQNVRSLVDAEPLSIIPKFSSVGSFHIVIAGGPAGKFSSFMPGFGLGVPPMSTAHLSSPVSRKVLLSPVAAAQEQVFANEPENVIVNPKAITSIQSFKPAKRSGKRGNVIGLLDISKPKSDQVLDRIGSLVKARYGADVELRRYKKETFSRNAKQELLEKMAAECKHVIGALAD
jgi:hypothetical protein